MARHEKLQEDPGKAPQGLSGFVKENRSVSCSMMVGTDNNWVSCLNRIASLGSPEEPMLLWNTNLIYQLVGHVGGASCLHWGC